MSRGIKKEIKRICRRVLSVTAVCLVRARGTGRNDEPVTVLNLYASQAEGRLAMGGGLTMKQPYRSRKKKSTGALGLFSKVLGSFPCPYKPVQPAVYRELLAYYNKLKKEFVLDFEMRCITAKPSSPHLRRRSELAHKPGLERPKRKLNLARDDLMAIPSLL